MCIRDRTEGVDTAIVLFCRPLQEEIKPEAVTINEEDRMPCVTAQDDMIDCTGIMYAGFAWHAGKITANNRMSSLTPKVCNNLPERCCAAPVENATLYNLFTLP